MQVLRAHTNDSENYSPAHGITGADVCCHAGWGPIRGSQTVGSMVSHLGKGTAHTHWLTGTAAPCTSLFRPIWMDTGVPEHGKVPIGTYDETALYWRHETLHRELLRDYSTRMPAVSTLLENAQEKMIDLATSNVKSAKNVRRSVSEECFQLADQAERECLAVGRKIKPVREPGLLYASAWRKFNKEAGIELE